MNRQDDAGVVRAWRCGLSGVPRQGGVDGRGGRDRRTAGGVHRRVLPDLGERLGVKLLPKVVKSQAEWKKQLSRVSYDVSRREDTEIPFTGATWNNHSKGLYRCICCDTALFSSETKFESGTGWPSFWQPISTQNVVERRRARSACAAAYRAGAATRTSATCSTMDRSRLAFATA